MLLAKALIECHELNSSIGHDLRNKAAEGFRVRGIHGDYRLVPAKDSSKTVLKAPTQSIMVVRCKMTVFGNGKRVYFSSCWIQSNNSTLEIDVCLHGNHRS